jgi:hypothetical protein
LRISAFSQNKKEEGIMKRFIHLTAIVVAALVLHIYGPAEGAEPVTSSVQIPLSRTVFVPLSDGSTDAVALSGMVHVLTHFAPDGPPLQPSLRIHINLDRVSGADGTYWIKRVPQPIIMVRDQGDATIQPFEPYMLLSAARASRALVPSIKYVLLPNPKGPNPGGHRFADNQETLVNTIIGWLQELKL